MSQNVVIRYRIEILQKDLFILSNPAEKLVEILQEYNSFKDRKYFSKRQLQSVIGKLCSQGGQTHQIVCQQVIRNTTYNGGIMYSSSSSNQSKIPK